MLNREIIGPGRDFADSAKSWSRKGRQGFGGGIAHVRISGPAGAGLCCKAKSWSRKGREGFGGGSP